jgi:hypothetical protein
LDGVYNLGIAPDVEKHFLLETEFATRSHDIADTAAFTDQKELTSLQLSTIQRNQIDDILSNF